MNVDLMRLLGVAGPGASATAVVRTSWGIQSLICDPDVLLWVWR